MARWVNRFVAATHRDWLQIESIASLTSARAALLQRFVLDERINDVQQLLLGLGVELFDLLQPPFQPRAERCLGGALGRRGIAEQLIGADVQRASEIGEQVRRRVIALGLVIGDAST